MTPHQLDFDLDGFEPVALEPAPVGGTWLHGDVVVVGARAAGAATAMLLARAGLDVILVDRSRFGADTVSTHALMRGAVIQLRRWGLLDALVAAGTPPIGGATFHVPTGETNLDFRAGDELYAPRRTLLDPLLVDAARDAGARVHYGLAVHDIRRDDAGRITGVSARDRQGRPFNIRARLVVGADGYHSAIARAVDAPVELVADGAASYLYRYWSGVDADRYESMYTRTATAGLIPTNDGLTCVFVGASPERLARGGPDIYAELLREANPQIAERVLAGTQVGTTRRAVGRPGRIRRPYGAGWALVGDAGYWKDPITAHGITDAFRDAELLARAVVAGFDTDTLVDQLATYHHERNRLSRDLFDVTDRIAGMGWTDDEIGPLLLDLSRSMRDEVETLHSLDPWPPTAHRASASLVTASAAD